MPGSSQFSLPSTFEWGVSTAAYQIEGAAHEGGRGPSSWDAFVHQSGRVLDGSTGDVACDHYHRYLEDITLMRELGVDAYRFSFSWSRIQPGGKGRTNEEGLAFYDRLVDGLLAAGITPTPTLFHWDTPLELEDVGGWRNRDITNRFADYAHLVGERFADRIPRWITINEPVVLTLFGYGAGLHAPGEKLGLGAIEVAHNQLLGHGRAVSALRAAGAKEIGIANNHAPVWPASDRDEDQQAAALYDLVTNRLFADPLLWGVYPAELEQMLPENAGDDLKEISTPIDWYGINYYNPNRVGAPDVAAGAGAVDGQEFDVGLPYRMVDIGGYPQTDFGWSVVPEAFTELLTGFAERYGSALPPIYITENGCAFNDVPDATDRVHDTRRIAYTEAHIAAIADAVSAGVDVRGYFHWSLLDNFEWAAGYTQRFGLIYVDYQSQKRTPKGSYYWYRDLIRSYR